MPLVVICAQVCTLPQVPCTQGTPLAHWGREPQRQPVAPQLSALAASHAAQVAPPTPHWERSPVRQAVPAQQPLPHEVESQTHWLLKQRCPAPHGALVPQRQAPAPQLFAVSESHVWQVEPAVPHWVGEGTATQVLPAQQPVAHTVASQIHWLLTQRSPAPQAALRPQRQPPLSQLSAVLVSQVVQAWPFAPQEPVETAVRHTPC